MIAGTTGQYVGNLLFPITIEEMQCVSSTDRWLGFSLLKLLLTAVSMIRFAHPAIIEHSREFHLLFITTSHRLVEFAMFKAFLEDFVQT